MSTGNEQIPSTDGSPAREARVRAAIDDCRCRRLAGEVVTDDVLIAAHPDLMPELAEELRKLRLIAAARQQAAQPVGPEVATRSHHDSDTGSGSGRLEVRCPSCHVPIDVAVDTSLTDLTCSSCGSHFSLVDQSKATRMAPSLTKLGRFELIERLGVGGFGSVWKARDKELDRTVAIKIPRAGGMTAEEQEKFFREARAAAQLRHPSIVSVYEVGRDGDSIYIVSEFVRGVTLGDWLTGQQLTNREAAELCAKIADALHHAHEQGIIHRDLKPANIMMDYDGQPHLMDFGLARRETGEVTMTMDGQVLGTPAYMSPEQAQGEAHTADRRSDVYSLGVIMFQLLTGELPFRGNARMLIKQVIQDEAPSPRKLNSNVPKDLETITLKCLEKDAAMRYQSACDLAAEFRRVLSGEPIWARPLGRPERTFRWIRRNKTISALSSAVALVLLTGIAVSTYFAFDARKQAAIALSRQKDALAAKEDAETERQNAESVASFLVESFKGINPYQADSTITGAEVLQRAEERIVGNLAVQPLVRATLLEAIGESWQGLGEESKAVKTLESAVRFFAQNLGPSHRRTLVARRKLAISYSQRGSRDQGVALLEQLLQQLIQQYGGEDSDTLTVMDSLGLAYQIDGHSKQAIPLHEQTLKANKEKFGLDHPNTLESMDLLGGAYAGVGRIDEAIELHQKTIQIKQNKIGTDNISTLKSMENLAVAYRNDRRLQQAIPIYENVVAQLNQKLGDRHTDTLFTMNRLGLAYWLAGKANKAIPVHERVLAARIEKWGTNNVDTLVSKSNLASAYADAGRIDDAIRLHEEVFAVRRNYDTDVRKFYTMHGLGYTYYLAGRFDDAIKFGAGAVSGRQSRRGPFHIETLTSLHNLLCSYHAAGELTYSAELAYLDYAIYIHALERARVANPDLAKSGTVIDNMERILPKIDPSMLAELKLGPNEEKEAELVIRATIARGTVPDFMYLNYGLCLRTARKLQQAKLAFVSVIEDRREKDGSYNLHDADINESAAAYFLKVIPEQQYIANAIADGNRACFAWFYVALQRDVDGNKEKAAEAYRRCIDIESDKSCSYLHALARRGLKMLDASSVSTQK